MEHGPAPSKTYGGMTDPETSPLFRPENCYSQTKQGCQSACIVRKRVDVFAAAATYI
jgi:hypothetical protein